MKKILTLFTMLFILAAFTVIPAKAAVKANISDNYIVAGQTKTIKLIKDSSNKAVSGKYTWSITCPDNVVYISSEKNSSAVKISCKKYGLNFKNSKNLDFDINDFYKAKLHCKVKNNKGKVIFNKTFNIEAYIKHYFKTIYLTPKTTKTITINAPSKENFFYVDSDDINKYVNPFTHSFKGSSITYPTKTSKKAIIKICPNKYVNKILNVSYYTNDLIYTTSIEVPEENWARIQKSNIDKKYTLAAYAIEMDPRYEKSATTIKKGNLFCVSCGSVKGSTYKILSGSNLINSTLAKKEYRAGDSYAFRKKDEWTGENQFDSRTNAYVTCGVYKAVKTGTVKFKVTYADKTTKIMTLKITN